MNPHPTPQQFRRAPSKTQTAVRCAIAAVVVAACAAVWFTAGPGNGVPPKPELEVLKLPTVVVVGKKSSEPVDPSSASVSTLDTVPAAAKAD